MKTAVLVLTFLAEAYAHLPCTKAAFDKIVPHNTTTIFATSIPENGSFGVAADLAYPGVPSSLPALCAVSFNVTSSPTSSFTFGMFLPESWSNRLFTVGNGAFSGGINWMDMAQGTYYGAACVSTDTGHNVSNGNDATWAYHNDEKIKDWAGRALHSSVVQAKDIVAAYYGNEAKHSYYSGCSTGGYQGMKEIQDYPEDFDGALVGSPAVSHDHIHPFFVFLRTFSLLKWPFGFLINSLTNI